MSLLHFFQPLDTLTIAERTGLPVHAISPANSAVERVLGGESPDRKRAHKRRYTTTFIAEDCAKVGKYAAQNRVAKAQKHFQQLNLSESTVCYFKKTYVAKVSKCVKTGDSTEVTHLKVAKYGSKIMLWDVLDSEIQWYNQHLQYLATGLL